MKKIERTLLIFLIIACIGMCIGSVLIAFSRYDSVIPTQNTNKQEISFSSVEIDMINTILNDQIYPGLMHSYEFPSNQFLNNSSFLKTDIDRFYFVFEMMRTNYSETVTCDIPEASDNTEEPEVTEYPCHFLATDFQKQYEAVFGKTLNFNLIQSEEIQLEEGKVTCIYNKKVEQPYFALRFQSLEYEENKYELTVNLYTKLIGNHVDKELVSTFANNSYISKQYWYGSFLIQYRVEGKNKIITSVSFQEA